jgi:ABC-2 type transport system permease protein
MNTFLSLFKKEVRSCFLSPIAFVVMFFFWILTGGNFILLLYQLANGESLTMATQWMFGGPLISFSLPVIVPLITMRLFAEERKLGTLEALLTTPAKVHELVLAKFCGALVFYMALWLPVFAYASFQSGMNPSETLAFPDLGALRAGAFGVLLVGSFYISVGLFLSSLTSNQIVAAIAGFAILFGAFLAGAYLAYTAPSASWRTIGQFFSASAHMMDFSRGVVDSRIVVLYLSFTAWFLFVAVKAVETKRT